MSFIVQTLNLFIDIYVILVVVRVLSDWLITDHHNTLRGFLVDATEPALMPIRRILPRMRVDLSPLILILLLDLIQSLLNRHF